MSNWKHGAPKVAFVSGGGSGIGLNLTRALLADGASVAIFDLRVEDALLHELRGLCKGDARVERYLVDITDHKAVEQAMDEAASTLGAPEFAINCAGILRTAVFTEMPYEMFDQSLRVNLYGSRNFAAGVLKHMRSGGHLALIASLAGMCGSYTHGAYATSKFGVVGLAEVLRTELKPKGIDVSVVCPGEIQTPMLEEERRVGSKVTEFLNEFAGVLPVDVAVQGILDGLRKRTFMITPGFKAKLTRYLVRSHTGLFRWIVDTKVAKALKIFGDRAQA
ncbi:SDR family NAD(P)-dependent oxidoreductase [Microbulbifer bruguierae]|uniref:SDR family NAD(P)-dependent oxidoreductase n=1 Tax=Microbulbifer bruguierae TaxID=3029061 RepID=A0ABY8NFC3_9GAMM|nr:SDR family NAD(P)-dependent oxidoreductase [Microbulbifer bruguierae]WGL17633.1 SDR family NAD(P)-dependent oxidoreductase [Microbulbifer bruguierae]